LQPHERGIAFLVQKAKCRIQPAYLKGTFEAWPRGRAFPKLCGKITTVFGSPIEWEEFEGLDKKEAQEKILARTEQAIRGLKDWLESGAQGNPP
jgi:1-acyl-sn-glycerol-3-phosphate acyltransferase